VEILRRELQALAGVDSTELDVKDLKRVQRLVEKEEKRIQTLKKNYSRNQAEVATSLSAPFDIEVALAPPAPAGNKKKKVHHATHVQQHRRLNLELEAETAEAVGRVRQLQNALTKERARVEYLTRDGIAVHVQRNEAEQKCDTAEAQAEAAARAARAAAAAAKDTAEWADAAVGKGEKAAASAVEAEQAAFIAKEKRMESRVARLESRVEAWKEKAADFEAEGKEARAEAKAAKAEADQKEEELLSLEATGNKKGRKPKRDLGRQRGREEAEEIRRRRGGRPPVPALAGRD
jgi:hypothetical protein